MVANQRRRPEARINTPSTGPKNACVMKGQNFEKKWACLPETPSQALPKAADKLSKHSYKMFLAICRTKAVVG
jgi:hypothetical protein